MSLDLRRTRLSVYDGVTDRSGVCVSLGAVLKRLREGGKGLAEMTETLNLLYKTDTPAYDKRKTTLPAVIWSGQFRGRKALIEHSGLCVVDLDDVKDIGGVILELRHAPFVFRNK